MMRHGNRLIIACGNSLRQDDGAGLQLANELAGHWRSQGLLHRFIQVQQMAPEHALEIASTEVDEVWFVDCRVARDPTETALHVRHLEVHETSPAIGHQSSPEQLLIYARYLFDPRLPDVQPEAWQITIPGYQFDHAEQLSERCQQVLAQAVQHIRDGLVDGDLPDNGDVLIVPGGRTYA